jgi:hypothetical protein
MRNARFFLGSFFILFSSCSALVLDSDEIQSDISGILVYVESGREEALEESLAMYEYDLEQEGIEYQVISWEGDASSLKEDLQNRDDETLCALFVGSIPWVYYYLDEETFPSDLYYSSPDTEWTDEDGDGVYDSHGSLYITLPVSRIIGTDEELVAYFDKIHSYRSNSLSFSDSAIIFKDDDWSDYMSGSYFGVNYFAGSVSIVEDVDYSTRDSYEESLDDAQKYLYQWIHANPSALYVEEDGSYNRFYRSDISSENVNVGFLNMFNCEGACFSEDNLAMTYLMSTDTTLAVTGSTKVGGNFEPLEFHRVLATGESWAEAYRQWYNEVGVYDDIWYLGMVILGDPLLVPEQAETTKSEGTDFSRLISSSQEEKDYFYTLMSEFNAP